jgi:hypothetical protein
MSVKTRAVELRVEGVERVTELGDRHARPGYEFVIVDTSWKNIIPLSLVDKTPQSPTGGFGLGAKRQAPDPANQSMEPTPYVVPALVNLFWLLSDDRFADPVDLAAQELVPNHLSAGGFGVAKLDEVIRGKLVFEAPAGAQYQAFQFYDVDHGHALIPLTDRKPAPAPTIGPPRQNDLVQLALTEARFLPSDSSSAPGTRRFLLGVRGISRSPRDIAVVPMKYLFAQTDQGCLASPEADPKGLTRAFGASATFVPTGANEGQLVVIVPAETHAIRLLLRAQNGGPIELPAAADFQPSWPAPVKSIADGTVMRVHVLPTPQPLPSLPAPSDGRALQLLDIVIENTNSKGVEFQPVQLRLQAGDGSFVEPSTLSSDVPCHLPSDGTIPPGTARRFTLVYEVPAGPPLRRLQYRGFELQEATVDLP